MPLRTRLLLLFVPLLLTTLAAVWLLAQNTLLARFDRSDREEISTRLEQLNRQLYFNQRQRLAIVRDWAWWDDTLAFIDNPSDDYLDSNLDDSTLENLNLHFILFFNAERQLIASLWRDVDEQTLLSLNEQPTTHAQTLPERTLSKLKQLGLDQTQADSEQGHALHLAIGNNAVLVVQAPVTDNDKTVSPRGSLVMGRFLDQQWLEEQQTQLRTPITFSQSAPSGSGYPLNNSLLVTHSSSLSYPPSSLPNQRLLGQLTVIDAQQQPQWNMHINLPRTLYLQGQSSVRFFLISAFVLAGIGLCIGFLAFEHWVLSPLRRIDDGIKDIASAQLKRLPLHGNDELTSLSHSINRMLEEREANVAREQMILDNIKDGYCELDRDGRFVRTNPTLLNLLGFNESNVAQHTCFDRLPDSIQHTAKKFFALAMQGEQKIPPFSSEYIRGDGSHGHFEIRLSHIHDQNGAVCGLRGILRDTTRQEAYQKTLLDMAYRDALTGLGNRKAFSEQLNNLCHTDEHFALLFIDLDQFKQVNDRFGHDIGDQLLKTMSKRLAGALRGEDQVFRLGGDEFTVLLPSTQRDHAWQVAQRLLSSAGEVCEVDGIRIDFVTPSIGLALFPDDANDSETLLRAADLAMYEAKLSRNHVVRFTTDLRSKNSSPEAQPKPS
ncbi:sensor domain-containing diguanylate cyclase [Atopomonas sediminilitoris]|uniref:sensor domain-containing diguanylate cyclase n=1 Tax=Atopomonas sediminilitoris TaxID=2919919 RepID=UPI001F4E01BE|nr:diguanylate cyclase [Atopomonas sediminilitoris]MCJ8170202.1 diguanylate cyclase [Atopomonas sediminilitoris]